MSKTWCIVAILAVLAFCQGWAIAADTDDNVGASPSARAAGDLPAKDIDQDVNKADIVQVIAARIMLGYSDGTFRPNGKVNEDSFAKIIERTLLVCSGASDASFSVRNPDLSVTRIRALAVVLRSVASQNGIESLTNPAERLASFSDAGSVPVWAQRYAAYAAGIGVLKNGQAVRPNEPITRSELAAMLARSLNWRMAGRPEPAALKKPIIHTSLVVDCRGFDVNRSMCPEIRTEAGEMLYPDYKNPPSVDFVETSGLVAYAQELSGTKRSGSTPLVVKAIGIAGTANQAAIVSDEDRELILAAEKNGHFLAKWNVVFLKD